MYESLHVSERIYDAISQTGTHTFGVLLTKQFILSFV